MAKLTEIQYWKWRCSIAEMWNAENKETARKWQLDALNKAAAIEAYKPQIFKLRDLANATKEKEECQKAYSQLKESIEEELGVSLSGVTIDDVTFEIKTLD